MQIIKLMLPLLLLGVSASAQQIAIGGGQVVINAGSQLSLNGLLLNPTTNLTLTNTSANTNTSATNPYSAPSVTRVYLISPTPFQFSGSIRFPYTDAELNGLDESTLKMINYKNPGWEPAGVSTPDPAGNFVDASGVTTISVHELMLVNTLALPLQWVSVSAQRRESVVTVKWTTAQEFQVSHFDVERSTDAKHWTVAVARIPATNQPLRKEYQQTDHPGSTGTVYYRIRQTDLDGRQTLSKTVLVAPEKLSNQMVILPNPAKTYFSIAGVASAGVSQVSVFNGSGILVKTWKGYQEQYYLSSLPAGTYLVKVRTTDGQESVSQLIIR